MSAAKGIFIELNGIDDLDRAIVNLSARIDAACYEQLTLIRQFDERGGWLKWAFPNCTEWLAWRCDLSLSAAREKVRVAHALKTLPRTSKAFSTGRLSYTKVRAITRVANDSNEDALVVFAQKNTAVRIEERCRELLCGTQASTEDANNAHARRSLNTRRHLSRGTMTITVELPLETGELLDKALDRARENTEQAEFAEESWGARQADALITIATSYLNGGEETGNHDNENYQINVHVDQSALVSGQGRSGLPLESVRRLSCDNDMIVVVEDKNEQPLNIGRKSRIVPRAIKRALWARDKGCAFPGCHRKRFVDAHHIHHWSAGGETSLENLVLLCSKHHRLVHEGGYRILKDYQDQWCFKRPDGMAVPECGYCPKDVTDEDADISFTASGNPSAEGFFTDVEKRRQYVEQSQSDGCFHQ